MSDAKITLYGMSHFFELHGDDLFKNLELPDGIDKNVLENNIVLKGAEFEVLYSNAYFFQEVIGTWSKKWYHTFEKWVKALAIEYNPLENYDRMEEWTDTSENHVIDHSVGNGNNGTNNNVSAFNSDSLVPDSSSYSNLHNENDSNTDTNGTTSRTGRLHGNIGVTTSQQMLQSELDIATWNIYEHITDLFLSDFVIPLY